MQPNSKIKICHLSSVHKATDTRIFYKECRSLTAEYDVTLIAISATDYKKDGVNIIGLKQLKSRISRFLVTDFILFIKALKVNARLYHFHDPELIIIGLILRLFGKKIIYDVHENVVADFDEKKWLPLKSLAKASYMFFENLALRNFEIVLADEAYLEQYKNRTGNFTIVQNYVPVNDLKREGHVYNTESNTIALVGYLSARRGLPFILEAIYILKQRGIMIRLRCVGEKNEDVIKILNQSKVWPDIQEQVEFKGYIPFPDSLFAIEDCMAGLALLETLPNNQKSLSTKIFEYMAVGLPVICSDFQVFKDIVEKYLCGLTANPENPEAIASVIETLYFDRNLASEMSKNAIMAVDNYSWKTEAEKLIDLYKNILKQN